MAVLSQWQASPLPAGFVVVGRWAVLAALAATLWLVMVPAYRLVQWQRGQGFDCPRCGGHERIGYARMGGAYWRCYACGDNVNHRHYE